MTRILLVEDDEEVGRRLEQVLTSAGYEIDRSYAVAGGARTWTADPMSLSLLMSGSPTGPVWMSPIGP
jgi:DNA-binding response OmpR family regulator